MMSARCENALQQLRAEYAAWLEQNPDVDLAHFCRTVAQGRRHYQHRIAISIDSQEQAITALRDELQNPADAIRSDPSASGPSASGQ